MWSLLPDRLATGVLRGPNAYNKLLVSAGTTLKHDEGRFREKMGLCVQIITLESMILYILARKMLNTWILIVRVNIFIMKI